MDSVTILVAEDDALVQATVVDALSEGGFQSTLATSGEEAIAFLKDGKSQFRAVVTDINLKDKLDGWEVARAAREIDPSMPVVYMTGSHSDDWASRGVPNSIMLAKPFAPAQLVTAISNLLNTGTPAA